MNKNHELNLEGAKNAFLSLEENRADLAWKKEAISLGLVPNQS